MAIARGLAVALALAVTAWFALGYRQAHDTARAQAVLMARHPHHRLTPAQARSVSSALSAAGWLNPDESVEILRSQLYLMEGRGPEATRIAEDAARSEPLNLSAWLQLVATTGHGPDFELAFKNIAKLHPPVR